MANSDNTCANLHVEDFHTGATDTFGLIYDKQKELQTSINGSINISQDNYSKIFGKNMSSTVYQDFIKNSLRFVYLLFEIVRLFFFEILRLVH